MAADIVEIVGGRVSGAVGKTGGTLCTSKKEGGPKDSYMLVKAYLNNSRLEKDNVLKVL